MRYLLCFIFPPLAVLACNKPGQAALNLLLTCCLWLPGTLHALFVVADTCANERTRMVVNAINPQQPQLIASQQPQVRRNGRAGLIILAGFLGLAIIGSFHRSENTSPPATTELAPSDVPISITAALSPLPTPVVQAAPGPIPPVEAATPRIQSPPDPSFEQLRAYYEARSRRSRPLSDEEALSEFNALQDRNYLPHAKRVHYDYRSDTYNWIGPGKGKRMSLPRVEFEKEMSD
jgi:uncharacterized membrane protein YqaE (UPF0057 family)